MPSTLPPIQSAALPPLVTRAAFDTRTLNAEARTVEVVWTTGERVRRGGLFSEPFEEELSLRAGHVRMERLNSGRAPVLADHNEFGLRDILGVVTRAWIVSENEARAELRFSKRAEVEPIWQDVVDGVLSNVSGGYRVHKYLDVTTASDKQRVLRAVDWEPKEISLVAVPAEIGAHVRSAGAGTTNPVEVETMEEQEPKPAGNTPPAPPPADQTRSDPPGSPPAPSPSPPADPPPNLDQVRREAAESESQRISEILTLTRQHGLSASDLERDLITGRRSMDQARTAILDHLVAQSNAPGITPYHRAHVGADGLERAMPAMLAAMLHRCDPRVKLEDVEGARDFRGMSLLDLARSCEEMRGRSTRGVDRMELAKRSLHSTSDFSQLLENLAGKRLLQAYEELAPTFEPIFRRTTNPDFKPTKRLRLGDAPVLAKVNEHGEVTRGTVSEAGEPIKVDTYGRTIGFTRQLLVNDDLGSLDRMVTMQGIRVRELESSLAWGIFIDNAAMSDSVALFHDDHANLIVNVLGIPGLSAGRKAMRLQKGLDGARINIQPRFLVVPPSLETEAEQLVRLPIVPAVTTNANPFQGSLTVIVEPLLEDISSTVWFLVADPARAETFEIANLAGQTGPMFDRREGFDILGLELRVVHDVGVAAVDHRGALKSAGTG